MSKKTYLVIVTLPELAAAHAEQEATVEAASWQQAVRLACEAISRRPHVLGRHVKSAKITFRVVAAADNHADRGEAAAGKAKQTRETVDQGWLFDR